MISLFEILFVLFVVIFVMAFFTIIAGFWRMRGMANKVFSLAEQEMERKLREGSATDAESPREPAVCSHCGGRVTAQVSQCPSCGAGLS